MDANASSNAYADPRAAPGVPRRGKVRCACRYCGAHVMAQAGFQVIGQCTNCGSFDVALVDGGLTAPRRSRPTAAARRRPG
jgi:hypothetical protein